MPPHITSINFVGSIPLSSNTEVFQTLSTGSLPLTRIPDGETDERQNFVRWQGSPSRIGKHPEVFLPAIRQIYGASPVDLNLSEDEKQNIMKRIESEGGPQTDYDTAAIESYQVFKVLKAQGTIKKDAKFLVGLPTPLSAITCFVRNDLQALYEEVYKASLFRALERIQDAVPRDELAIQWDAPMEICMLEGRGFPMRSGESMGVEKYWDGDALHGIVQRIAECVGRVREGVDVGLHVCYGNQGNKHFLEPKNMELMVDVVEGVRSALGRNEHCLRWVHMPVPKCVEQKNFFEALGRMNWNWTELVLGLVHAGDLDGTRKRIELAGEVVHNFGVSSECGLGRSTREDLESIMEIYGAVSANK